MDKTKPVIPAVYLHVSNGGISFAITNEFGPTIDIDSAMFSNVLSRVKTHTDVAALKAIGHMFLDAAEHKFDEPYCCAATMPEKRGSAGGKARAKVMSGEARSKSASKAANARWDEARKPSEQEKKNANFNQ